MPSPDIASYVDLDLVDRDPQDVWDIAKQHLKVTFPELNLREGMMETVLLEAVALEVAESIFAINRLPDVITEVLLQFFGVTRDAGQPPVVDINFTISGQQGATIPVGSQFVLSSDNGIEPMVFTTDAELVIPMGAQSGTITATGQTFTDIYNGTPSGTLLQPQESILYLDYAHTANTVSEGRDPETDDEYLSRGVRSLQQLSSTLCVPDQFVAATLEHPFTSRALALDAYNPDNDPDGEGPVGQDGGFMTIAVYGDNEFVSADNKETLVEQLDNDAQANLFVKIIDPKITPITVEAEIAIDPNVAPEDVSAAVEAVIRETLSPENWPWGTVVRRSHLLSLITNIPGVDYVNDLIQPATDITLTGVANLVTVPPNGCIIHTI